MAPDFLVERNLHSLLSESAGGNSPDVDGKHTVEINNGEVGHMWLTYRTEQLRSDDDSDRDGELVLDEHGRPLELLYGVVSRHQSPDGVDEHDLQRAREEAFNSYHFFLAEESTFEVHVSRPFPLHGSKALFLPSDADFPAPDRPDIAKVASPTAEAIRPPEDSAARGTASLSTTQARRRRIGFGGGAVIVGAVLVALLLLWWALPDPAVCVQVEPGNEVGCAEGRMLVGTISAKEPSKVMYHWEGWGENGGQHEPEFKTPSAPLKSQIPGEQKVYLHVPTEPRGGVRKGTHSLVIDQPKELKQKVDQAVSCKE